MRETFCSEDGKILKELMEARIETVLTLTNANDRNVNQRIDNVVQTIKEGLEAANKQNALALAASDRATSKAEAAAEKRFEGVNEFRGTLADQQRTLMPRLEYEVQHKALDEKLGSINKSLNDKIDGLNVTTISKQSKDLGQREGIGMVVLVAGLVSTLVAILSRFIK